MNSSTNRKTSMAKMASTSKSTETTSNTIKSMAVVKFAPVQVPSFLRLQCNTDLNSPPSNWLSDTAHTYGLHPPQTHSHDFSSFRMAHQFPDCAGEVDVISDSENIKKLLKMPMSPNTVISMVVHRVGNALLIDDFDLTTYLLRRSHDDWEWLSSFIFETIIQSLSIKDIRQVIKSKNLDALQKKSLLSKFLYRSISDGSNAKLDLKITNDTTNQVHIKSHDQMANKLPDILLPEPNVADNMPGRNSSTHNFARNVVWTFEDIRMLIGTDMPIFGGASRPCISLRLGDMAKPINVLTGIDYWLDNLMSNVPEVMMCFHLDGFVQKYEPIKTEDLPNLENSKFAPKVITNVAKNILAFLKANATKAGHTYWLFKGCNDELVKLYDLTTLCAKKAEVQNMQFDDATDNPFTIPVAILLYTVAKNMKDSAMKHSAKRAGSIKTLLDNCVKLLPCEKYPQIVASSYYILSDLYVPAGTDPNAPDFEDPAEEEDAFADEDFPRFGVDDDDEDLEFDRESNAPEDDAIAYKYLKDTINECKLEKNWNVLPPPLSGSILERCNMALHNARLGLQCLRQNATQHTKEKDEEVQKNALKRKILHEEQNLNILHGNERIPLHWNNPVHETTAGGSGGAANSSTLLDNDKNNVQEYQSTTASNSWQIHMKMLMYEKAAVAYATLTELKYASQNYGRALRCIHMALACEEMVQHCAPERSHRMSCMYGRAGDIFLGMAKMESEIGRFLLEWNEYHDIDEFFLTEDIGERASNSVFTGMAINSKEMLITSYKCYEAAIAVSVSKDSEPAERKLLMRLANINNELGVKEMQYCQDLFHGFTGDANMKDPKKLATLNELSPLCYNHFTRALDIFELLEDYTNYALVMCNCGRFLKMRSRIDLHYGEVARFKKTHDEALSMYQTALSKVNKDVNRDLWEVVNWELSSAYFNMALLLFDEVNREDRDIVDLLQKSLKICETIDSPTDPMHLRNAKRMALLYKRIGQYYVVAYEKTADAKKRKHAYHLATLNFSKGISLYSSDLDRNCDFLNAQLQRVTLEHALFKNATNKKQKLVHLKTALDILNEAWAAFVVDDEDNDADDVAEETFSEFESFLQLTLKEFNVTLGKPPPTGDEITQLEFYKTAYKMSLRFPKAAVRWVIEENITKVLLFISQN